MVSCAGVAVGWGGSGGGDTTGRGDWELAGGPQAGFHTLGGCWDKGLCTAGRAWPMGSDLPRQWSPGTASQKRTKTGSSPPCQAQLQGSQAPLAARPPSLALPNSPSGPLTKGGWQRVGPLQGIDQCPDAVHEAAAHY